MLSWHRPVSGDQQDWSLGLGWRQITHRTPWRVVCIHEAVHACTATTQLCRSVGCWNHAIYVMCPSFCLFPNGLSLLLLQASAAAWCASVWG